MGLRARVLLAATFALLLAAALAPVAHAVGATVRVEGTPYEVAPATTVSVPASGTIVDSDGTEFAYPATADAVGANALAALDRAAALRGVTYGFNMSWGAPFLEMIAGLTADPADWSNGWTYMVNGVGWPILDMGAVDCALRAGDAVVFAQNPDATFSRGTKLLRLRFAPGRGVQPGETVTITVLGDDVAKANSAAEATRWGLDPVADPAIVEKPADFAPVTGVTLHVGSRIYIDGAGGDIADGKIALSDLPKGTYGVWAEMAMDAGYSYVRSGVHRMNVDFGPRVTSVAARAGFDGTRLVTRAAFTLDKRCDVRVTVFNQRGKRLATMRAGNLGSGRHALAWRGRPAAAVTSLASVVVTATDTWGRVTTKAVAVRVAR
jgi:hypothetical protein